MTTKELKVGDTFLEGKLVYKVTKVVGSKVEASWTGETSSETSVFTEANVKEEVKEEVRVEEEEVDLYSISYAQLKKMCAEKGLDAKGSKADLIARLEG